MKKMKAEVWQRMGKYHQRNWTKFKNSKLSQSPHTVHNRCNSFEKNAFTKPQVQHALGSSSAAGADSLLNAQQTWPTVKRNLGMVLPKIDFQFFKKKREECSQHVHLKISNATACKSFKNNKVKYRNN